MVVAAPESLTTPGGEILGSRAEKANVQNRKGQEQGGRDAQGSYDIVPLCRKPRILGSMKEPTTDSKSSVIKIVQRDLLLLGPPCDTDRLLT